VTAAPAPALVCIGETMALMSSERPGPLRTQRGLALGIGGSESNVAIAASRLGVPTAWVGKVGDDELGELVLREIRGEAVHVQASVDPERPTGLMVKERRAPGSSRVWYYRAGSAGSALTVADVDRGLVERARVLHISGISLGIDGPIAGTVRAAIEWARASGVAVSCDLNHRARLWGPERFGAALRELVPLFDVVFGSEHELSYVVGDGCPAEQLGRLADLGVPEAVAKRGADGACALVDGELIESPAVPVTVVDTVGAGDAFVAGWLCGRLAGAAPRERLATAVICGALACTVEGDWEGSPSAREVAAHGRAVDPVER
jgi:2-dehydro-3-deoxygluconokinase